MGYIPTPGYVPTHLSGVYSNARVCSTPSLWGIFQRPGMFQPISLGMFQPVSLAHIHTDLVLEVDRCVLRRLKAFLVAFVA